MSYEVEEALGLIGTTLTYIDLLEQKGPDIIDNFKSALQLMEEQEQSDGR